MKKLEKIKNLVLYFKKKIFQKNNSQESEEEIGKFSMNEGKVDKVFGFRREIIKGVAMFFGTVLILAFIFASSDAGENKTETDTMPKVTESEIATQKKPKNELPNDYETLIAMNRAKEEELRRQAEENAKKQQSEQVQVIETAPVTEIPAIPQAEYKVLPAQVPQLPEENEESAKIEKISQEKNEKYKSAISFAIGENQNLNQNNFSNAESEKNNSPQKKTEYHAPNDSTLDAGTVIPVRLLTGINTDVEGQVMAQVLTDIYDTATGTKLLIPQGSKLTGFYEKKSVKNGRVPIKFKQLNFPNGGSWIISENIVAVDGAGYSGISGKIHHHTGQKISAGAIGASIAALGSLAAGNTSAQNTYSAGQIAAQGAMANLINSTATLLKESSEIENTVTIEPGYEFNVYVTENLTFFGE